MKTIICDHCGTEINPLQESQHKVYGENNKPIRGVFICGECYKNRLLVNYPRTAFEWQYQPGRRVLYNITIGYEKKMEQKQYIDKNFIPYEETKILHRELSFGLATGFESTLGVVYKDGVVFPGSYDLCRILKSRASETDKPEYAILWQQAFDFFEDKYGLFPEWSWNCRLKGKYMISIHNKEEFCLYKDNKEYEKPEMRLKLLRELIRLARKQKKNK